MVEVLLNILLWVVLIGFTTFCILYGIWTRPWVDQMGRHVLFFMGGLAWAFAYAVLSRYIQQDLRLVGWAVVLTIIAFLVWWRVVILVRYHLASQRKESGVK